MSTFVDTSVWYASADRSDRKNVRPKRLLEQNAPLLVTDHILAEGWNLIHHRLGAEAAGRFWRACRAVKIEVVGKQDLEAAWRIARRFADESFSVTDCTSFAVMERLGVFRAAAFDHHFSIYRFGPGNRRAFEVLS